jgi:excisionase family DNA binding protein
MAYKKAAAHEATGTVMSLEIANNQMLSLPQRIEGLKRALTAAELAVLLAISPITIYKMAKSGRIPCFRIGTAVRFDPHQIAEWLRDKIY